MKIKNIIKKPFALVLTLMVGVVSTPTFGVYYTADEYETIAQGIIYEDKGIVLENYPALGYLVYRNLYGEVIRAPYYTSALVVEKEGIHEIEDRVGYIDELFPYFQYDPRDTTIDNVKAGDNIYLRTDKEGYVTYISAYNDYMLRYGKVISWRITNGQTGELIIQDEKAQTFIYEVPLSTPTSKSNRPYDIGSIRAGEWVKLLVSQKVLGVGVIEEIVQEIVVDGDTRVISGVYKGEILQLGTYEKNIKLARAQELGLSGWGSYTDILTLDADPRNFNAFIMGQQYSWDYIGRYLSGSQMNANVALEDYMGKSSVVKMNVQDTFQTTLSPSQVIYSVPGEIKLLSGETLSLGADTIVVKDERLIDTNNILVGDTVQLVVSRDNTVTVANILQNVSSGLLQVFRGRIKEIDNRESFIVETFSLLDSNEWYFHPQPRTFTIDYNTVFYNDNGFVQDGIEDFFSYGENTQVSEVYTIVASGDQALLISNMPYTRETLQGEIYNVDGDTVYLKDVYHYDVDDNRWFEYSSMNYGITATLESNSIIIKNGQLISIDDLEQGDTVSVMLEDHLTDYVAEAELEVGAILDVPGYILLVK